VGCAQEHERHTLHIVVVCVCVVTLAVRVRYLASAVGMGARLATKRVTRKSESRKEANHSKAGVGAGELIINHSLVS
jgi:hypothetical protein